MRSLRRAGRSDLKLAAVSRALAIRQLSRRFGSLDEGSRELLSFLTLQRLEQLAEDLLDFTKPGYLQAWFDNHPAG